MANRSPELVTGDAVVLDIREQDEWDRGHAPGAVHIPMSELPARVDELGEEDKITVARARKIEQFLSQNTYMAKKFTGVEGSTVPIKETIESFDAIVKGDFDHVAEQAFFNVGGISDVEEKWAQIQRENG